MMVLYVRTALFIVVFITLLNAAALLLGRNIPTGETIAHLQHPQQEITWSIIIRDLDRSLSYDLTRLLEMTNIRNRLPNWSPDGKQIAFLSERGGGLDIFVADVQRREVRPITRTGEIINALEWSPDSRHILFDLTAQTGERGLYLVDVATGETSSLLQTQGTYDILPRWSINGDVAFISNRNSGGNLYLWSGQTGQVIRLTEDLSASGYMSWSPDGTELAFTAMDLTPSNPQIIYTDVYILNTTRLEQAPTRIEITGNERDVVWSPDGSKIAFVNDSTGDDEVFVVEATGVNIQQITDNYFPDYSPAWSPDSTRLMWVFAPAFGSTSDLALYNFVIGQQQTLTFNEIDDWYPIWRP
jgi:Tol biopolymer transport system component